MPHASATCLLQEYPTVSHSIPQYPTCLLQEYPTATSHSNAQSTGSVMTIAYLE